MLVPPLRPPHYKNPKSEAPGASFLRYNQPNLDGNRADWSVFCRSEPDFGPFFTVPTTIQPILLLQLDAQKNLEESGNFFFHALNAQPLTS